MLIASYYYVSDQKRSVETAGDFSTEVENPKLLNSGVCA